MVIDLPAVMKKAVEVGMFPAMPSQDTYLLRYEQLHEVLKFAFELQEKPSVPTDTQPRKEKPQ